MVKESSARVTRFEGRLSGRNDEGSTAPFDPKQPITELPRTAASQRLLSVVGAR